tara:strand:+ start:13061 stop:13831 length:771 start_codon:yes stop_codon:yes gene_type:complete
LSLHIEQSPETAESPEVAEVTQAEVAPEQPQEITTRPDDIPEKFWDTTSGTVNTKALLESYTHLEQKMSAKEPEAPKEPEAKPDDGDTVEPDAPSFDEAIQKATEEFQANGELSDEMMKSLGDIGISEALINGYIKGVEADSKAALGEVHTVAGSEESWTEIMEWAALNISADKTKELNEGLASNDNRINTAIELKSLFDNAVHNPQVTIQGSSASITGDTGPFKSQGELIAAMSDPRYKSDTNYQQKVHARLAKM